MAVSVEYISGVCGRSAANQVAVAGKKRTVWVGKGTTPVSVPERAIAYLTDMVEVIFLDRQGKPVEERVTGSRRVGPMGPNARFVAERSSTIPSEKEVVEFATDEYVGCYPVFGK